MSIFIELLDDLVVSILTEYLAVNDLIQFDCSLCSFTLRRRIHSIMNKPFFKIRGFSVMVVPNVEYCKWLSVRGISPINIFIDEVCDVSKFKTESTASLYFKESDQINVVKVLSMCSNLTRLDLSPFSLTLFESSTIIPRISKIKTLILWKCADTIILDTIGDNCPCLTDLTAHYNDLTFDMLRNLATKCKGLKALSLGSLNWVVSGLETLFEINCSLERLKLGRSSVMPFETADRLMVRFPQIRCFNVGKYTADRNPVDNRIALSLFEDVDDVDIDLIFENSGRILGDKCEAICFFKIGTPTNGKIIKSIYTHLLSLSTHTSVS